jgi:hypothetical protein
MGHYVSHRWGDILLMEDRFPEHYFLSPCSVFLSINGHQSKYHAENMVILALKLVHFDLFMNPLEEFMIRGFSCVS